MRLVAALAVLLLCGCAGPGLPGGRTDRWADVRQVEFSLDAPSSGPSGYTVNLEVFAYNADRSESYAFAADAHVHIDAMPYLSGKGACVPGKTAFDFDRSLTMDEFRNKVGAGEHWSLPLPITDAAFGAGQYNVTVTIGEGDMSFSASGSFLHC